MFEFVSKYNPFIWGRNGPERVVETLKIYCNFDHSYKKFYKHLLLNENQTHTGKKNECDITIFPEDFFYPFKYYASQPKLIFKENGLENISRLKNTYSLHLYGKISDNLIIQNNSIYENLSKIFCRATFKL